MTKNDLHFDQVFFAVQTIRLHYKLLMWITNNNNSTFHTIQLQADSHITRSKINVSVWLSRCGQVWGAMDVVEKVSDPFIQKYLYFSTLNSEQFKYKFKFKLFTFGQIAWLLVGQTISTDHSKWNERNLECSIFFFFFDCSHEYTRVVISRLDWISLSIQRVIFLIK